jgi:hypothetical protein
MCRTLNLEWTCIDLSQGLDRQGRVSQSDGRRAAGFRGDDWGRQSL